MVALYPDPKVTFPNIFVRGRTKTEMRRFIAEHARLWIRTQHRRGVKGAIMIDIDDTLIDGNETVANGFQWMKALFDEMSLLYPVYIVTARPDDAHAEVMRMLRQKGFSIAPDRLHMLESGLYYERDLTKVEKFKWGVFQKIQKDHGRVVARFGDKLWDVAHIDSLHSYLSHVRDREACIFFDPRLKGTLSAKLPG